MNIYFKALTGAVTIGAAAYGIYKYRLKIGAVTVAVVNDTPKVVADVTVTVNDVKTEVKDVETAAKS